MSTIWELEARIAKLESLFAAVVFSPWVDASLRDVLRQEILKTPASAGVGGPTVSGVLYSPEEASSTSTTDS